jgi:trehalose synthase
MGNTEERKLHKLKGLKSKQVVLLRRQNRHVMNVAGNLLQERYVASLSIEPMRQLLGAAPASELDRHIERARQLLIGRVVWNINSTGVGGGVAEMLQSLLAYARGAAIDARWLVISGDEGFFQVTKRLHNFLHGNGGDGKALGAAEQEAYRATMKRNAAALAAVVHRGDVVILHDPQTAGLIAPLKAMGAVVVWRSHVGAESVNSFVESGWKFLRPFVAGADAYVFSRHGYVPSGLCGDRVEIIPPAIDPFSPKNQDLAPEVIRALMQHVGLVAGNERNGAAPVFRRLDGSPGRVERHCDVQSTGPPPDFDTPIVVQVSRWDRLKDPLGVMRGFVDHVVPHLDAHLILAGPTVHAVADDPEGEQVLDEIERAWRALPQFSRSRVHLACLPMSDIEENAAIVNALQRHAAVVVQKSLQEGFGLTVTEAMWKARPVIASSVGGIVDQIEDGQTGLLLRDPSDLTGFGRLVRHVLADKERAQHLGEQAKLRVQRDFLFHRSLIQFLGMLGQLIH